MSRSSCQSRANVGVTEIAALEQERLVHMKCKSICKTVAKVQLRLVARALSETIMCASRELGLGLINRNHLNTCGFKKPVQNLFCAYHLTSAQYNRTLNN